MQVRLPWQMQRAIPYNPAMRSTIRNMTALAAITVTLATGCQAAMHVAHMMVEGEGIKRNVDQFSNRDSLISAADAEAAKARRVR
jgi:hypothetical protein